LKRAARNLPQKMQFLTFSLERKAISQSQEGGKRVGVVHSNFWGLGGGKVVLVLVIKNKLKRAARNWPQKM
jgi:hypothetical protein